MIGESERSNEYKRQSKRKKKAGKKGIKREVEREGPKSCLMSSIGALWRNASINADTAVELLVNI